MSDQDPEDELARSDRAWAAQAEAYSQPHVPPATGGATGGGSSGGGGSASSANRPMGPKPVKGPSGNAMTWMRGLGLLSILAVIAIMALLSWRILSDTGGDDVDVVRDPGPAAVAPTDGGADPTPQAEPGLGSADAALAARCETDLTTVETAKEAYAISEGTPPADVQALIDAGYLTADADIGAAIAADGSVVAAGECAGG